MNQLISIFQYALSSTRTAVLTMKLRYYQKNLSWFNLEYMDFRRNHGDKHPRELVEEKERGNWKPRNSYESDMVTYYNEYRKLVNRIKALQHELQRSTVLQTAAA